MVALCACNPITLRALDIGHPEELLGAALSAGAVLAALRGRPTLGGRAARARGRQQGVGAAGGRARCLLALPERRVWALVIAVGRSRSRSWLPCCSRAPPAGQPGVHAASTGVIFQPWQVWWFFGSAAEGIRGADGLIKAGYRAPPAG